MKLRVANGLRQLKGHAREIDLIQTGSGKFGAMALGFLVNVAVLALITRKNGTEEYALYALLGSFVNLLPFADLGLGAAVVNATADRLAGVSNQSTYLDKLGRTRDILVLAATAIIVGDLVLLATGWWGLLLGSLSSVYGAEVVATVSVGIIAVAVPFGIGNRILQGAGRMREVTAIGMVGPVVVFSVVGALFLAGAPAAAYAIAPSLAFLAMAVAAVVRSRSVVAYKIQRPYSYSGRHDGDLFSTAAPFFLISVGMAVGFQSHRLILVHFSTPSVVAQYSVAAQFGGPALAVLTVIGQNLWSHYRVKNARAGVGVSEYARHVLLIGGVGLLAAVVLTVTVPSLGMWLTAGTVQVSYGTMLALGFYLLVVAVHQPGAMMLNDSRGLWLQAGLVVATAAIAVPLTIALVPELGASAPYGVLAGTMLVVQVMPTAIVCVRRTASSTDQDTVVSRGV